MSRMFTFVPEEYAPSFAARDYVHIRRGLSDQFFGALERQVDDYMQSSRIENYHVGDKQQAVYEFPNRADCDEFIDGMARICGLDAGQIVIAERHFKSYDASANPSPLAHKDRFATQIAVGFSVRVREGSTLVLYPDSDRASNPFGSSTEYRASLDPSQYPEHTLRDSQPVEIQDRPGDIVIFRGSSIWHLRRQPANTVMLYFKINAFHCDTLGEDAGTLEWENRTRRLAEGSNDDLRALVPLLARRVDYIHQRWTRDWQQLYGVILRGKPHLTIDAQEFEWLRSMDGRRSLGEVLGMTDHGAVAAGACEKIRRLARHGIIDLTPSPAATNAHAEAVHARIPKPALLHPRTTSATE